MLCAFVFAALPLFQSRFGIPIYTFIRKSHSDCNSRLSEGLDIGCMSPNISTGCTENMVFYHMVFRHQHRQQHGSNLYQRKLVCLEKINLPSMCTEHTNKRACGTANAHTCSHVYMYTYRAYIVQAYVNITFLAVTTHQAARGLPLQSRIKHCHSCVDGGICLFFKIIWLSSAFD